MSHRVKVKITADGKVEVSVEGMTGASCSDATKAVERALGTTTSDKRTSEFYRTAANVQGHRITNEGGK